MVELLRVLAFVVGDPEGAIWGKGEIERNRELPIARSEAAERSDDMNERSAVGASRKLSVSTEHALNVSLNKVAGISEWRRAMSNNAPMAAGIFNRARLEMAWFLTTGSASCNASIRNGSDAADFI